MSAVSTVVLNPEQLEEGIRSASIEPLQLSASPSTSRLVRVICPSICLDIVELGPAMLFSGTMAEDCYTMIVVTKCPTVGRSFNFRVEHLDGYMGFFPPGEQLDAYTPEGYANASLVIPKALFLRSLKAHLPEITSERLRRGLVIKVGSVAMSALTKTLESVEQDLLDPARPLEKPENRQKLEANLLPAFLNALKRGLENDTPTFGSRTMGRVEHLRLAREFVNRNAHRAFELEELCQAIGMSPRGVELLFRESLDISPNTFIRNRRLHGVRRVLLDSDAKTGLVKESAMAWGFMHMGHFSRNYRQLFGETPSETVSR